jgi:hypothetical protein
MAALTPSELLECVAWAAACPRGELSRRALAAAQALAASPSSPPGTPASPHFTPVMRGAFAATAAGVAGGGAIPGGDTVAAAQLLHLLRALRATALAGAVDGAWLQETYGPWRAALFGVMRAAQAARLEAEKAEAEAAAGGGAGAGEGEGLGTDQQEPSPQQQQEQQDQKDAEEAEEGKDGIGSPAGKIEAGSTVEEAPGAQEEEGAGVDAAPAVASLACVEALLSAAAEWCIARRRVTSGTMSILRQVGLHFV